mgnify:CR=1 FL=1
MFDTSQHFFKKTFTCVKCREPCLETLFCEELEELGEIWLLCETCLENTSPSVDLLSPREFLPLH